MVAKEKTKQQLPLPLTSSDVTATIRRCLTSGRIIPTKHFSDQSFLRNYTIQDAINVLEKGQVSGEAPEWNNDAHRWGYRVHGPDLEGELLTVVVGIGVRRDLVWLVTAYD